eukprot:1384857-Amphidinium_carterae.1
MVLIYVDDLFIIGKKEVGEEFINNIRERLQLKHVSPLTPSSSIEFLGTTISMDSNYNYTIKFPESYYNKILKPWGQKLTTTSEDPTNTPLSSHEAETYRTTVVSSYGSADLELTSASAPKS